MTSPFTKPYHALMDIKIEGLVNRIGSKYALATLCSKRTREINQGGKILIEEVGGKSDVVAMKEIAAEKIKIGPYVKEVTPPPAAL